jgi:hypothetical protein
MIDQPHHCGTVARSWRHSSLLVRATRRRRWRGLEDLPADETPADGRDEKGQFDPQRVSEMVWVKWRETVRRQGIGGEKLGRLTPSLQSLPSVVWNTPLSFYLDMTLSQIRNLKTHGEKRVAVVLEVFHTIHEMLGHIDPQADLAVRLAPRTIVSAEEWMAEAKSRSFPPTREEVEQQLIEPILQQLGIDAGDTVAKLARGRLGVNIEAESVRNQSKSLGVTRARVYQMLEECHNVMSIRWSDGRRQLDEFAQWLDESYASAEAANLLASVRERPPARPTPSPSTCGPKDPKRLSPTLLASAEPCPPVQHLSVSPSLSLCLSVPIALRSRRPDPPSARLARCWRESARGGCLPSQRSSCWARISCPSTRARPLVVTMSEPIGGTRAQFS